ncbi:GHKL domain-containing protein, partial [Clostridioides mangenotii]|uniref:GHKL domain-containing protein n=1 Tax=Metaclostridioides mangenotii TaxID=1540 RepID=UPI002149E63B
KIKIESKYIESFCIIVIENTKINKIEQKNNNFLSSKKDKSIHGIGLKNVKNSVKKYSGELITEQYKNKFILKIMMPSNG